MSRLFCKASSFKVSSFKLPVFIMSAIFGDALFEDAPAFYKEFEDFIASQPLHSSPRHLQAVITINYTMKFHNEQLCETAVLKTLPARVECLQEMEEWWSRHLKLPTIKLLSRLLDGDLVGINYF